MEETPETGETTTTTTEPEAAALPVTSGEVNLERTGVAGVAPPVPGAHDAHPSPAKYVGVAAILVVVTAVEVGLYYTSLGGLVLVSMLVGLAFIKFGMVAAYFMHLKFDGRLLRRLFVAGILLALSVYAVVLFTLDVLFG